MIYGLNVTTFHLHKKNLISRSNIIDEIFSVRKLKNVGTIFENLVQDIFISSWSLTSSPEKSTKTPRNF